MASVWIDLAHGNTVLVVGSDDVTFPSGVNAQKLTLDSTAFQTVLAAFTTGQIVQVDPTTLAITTSQRPVVDPLVNPRQAFVSAIAAEVTAGRLSQTFATALTNLLVAIGQRLR